MKTQKRKKEEARLSKEHFRALDTYFKHLEKEKAKKIVLEPWLARLVKKLKADPYFADNDVEADAREFQAMINAMTPTQRKRFAKA